MKFGFVDEHRSVWLIRVMCAALDLLASGYTLSTFREKIALPPLAIIEDVGALIQATTRDIKRAIIHPSS